MRTAGIDFAAQTANTAAAVIDWADGTAHLVTVEVGVDDDRCIDIITGADKTGIDAPFGWPTPFVDFIAAVDRGELEAPPDTDIDWRRRLVYRQTDLVVRDHLGRSPLSVSADLIAHPAFRLAGLLARFDGTGVDVDRSGRGRIIEAYPALSLRLWGMPNSGYKRDPAKLGELVDSVVAAAPWLELGEHRSTLAGTDHAFDALIAALTARASARGLIVEPGTDQLATARREGWTAIPTVSLGDLADD